MNTETIKKLREVPVFRELVGFIATEIAKLDSLDGLETLTFSERAYEVTSRIRAKEALAGILGPLVGDVDKPAGIDPKEYLV